MSDGKHLGYRPKSVSLSVKELEVRVRELEAENELMAREILELRAESQRLLEERDLAIAHDRQPYPTAHAYEAVCQARDKWQARAERVQQELTRRIRKDLTEARAALDAGVKETNDE